ncbi:MAG: preprotein translocase subunit SecG [Clostridia bacterium]|nr:preprotein translocase subunit SecG [Clostridia bacterium]
MEVAQWIIGSALILLSVVMTVLILMQTGKDEGLSGAISGGSSDTFFGRSGGSKKEKWLSRVTIILSIVFVVLAVALVILASMPAA